MSTTTRTIIGPADHGRKMGFDEFIEAETEGGYLYELARGVIDVSEVPGIDHGEVVDRLTQMFCDFRREHPGVIKYRAGGGECRIRIRGMSSDRHPDQAIYLDPQPEVETRVWEHWVPTIVVEVVSVGGEDRDYVEKSEEYLKFGVQEYWILDPSDRALIVHRRVGDELDIPLIEPGATYQTPLLPGLDVRPDELFGPAI
jgi:Uma2 family endonuclease